MSHEGQHYVGRGSLSFKHFSLLVCCSLLFAFQGFAATAPQKEWTFLIYLNGNNSLDSFGTDNMKQMETVGSTDSVNIVVQWASEAAGNTKRILVKKSTDSSQVTSPVVQQMGAVDMGDYKQLVEFAKWGMATYPAKHYFINVWNHGNGWHKKRIVRDISYDDVSGNHMTTAQFGEAIRQISKIAGDKIDIVGTDACLMAMAEVGGELADSARYLLASEEVEPGPGWPYDTFLQHWTAKKEASVEDVSNYLVKDYVDTYTSQSTDVTFSALDLSKQSQMETAIAGLTNALKGMSATEQKKVLSAAQSTLHFTLSDYADVGDLVAHLRTAGPTSVSSDVLAEVETALKSYVFANDDTTQFKSAHGVSMWMPTDKYTFQQYSSLYGGLKFATNSGWLNELTSLFK